MSSSFAYNCFVLAVIRVIFFCLFLFALLKGADVHAEDEIAWRGQLGFAIAARDNLEELGQDYHWGFFLIGIRAGADLEFGDSDWSLGMMMTSLVRGYYFASDSELVNQQAKVTEFVPSIRGRRRLTDYPHFLVASLGGVFTSSNIPLPPSEKRRYFGIQGSLGYERSLGYDRLFLKNLSWSLDASYTRFLQGPRNLSVTVAISYGLTE